MAADPVTTAAAPAAERGFFGRTAITLGSRLLDLPTRYGMHLLVALRLGVEGSGKFYIVFSVLSLAAGGGRIGIDRALTREVARAMACDAPAEARRVIGRALLLVTALSCTAALAMAALALPIAQHVVGDGALALPLALAAAAIVPLALGVVAAGALAGLQQMAQSQMLYSWGWPALFCAGALLLPIDVTRAVLLIVGATTATALSGLALLWWQLPRGAGAGDAERPVPTPLVPLGFALFTTEIFQLLLSSAPALVLGVVADARAVGLYALAWRVALILNLLVSAIAAMAAPRFAALHARDATAGLRREAEAAIGTVLLLGILPLGLMLAMPERVLGVFGPGFGAGGLTLRILAVGQLIAMSSTALPELIGMTGHALALRRLNALSIASLLVLLAVLAPLWGAAGAAVAIMLTAAINAAALGQLVRHLLAFHPLHTLGQRLCRTR